MTIDVRSRLLVFRLTVLLGGDQVCSEFLVAEGVRVHLALFDGVEQADVAHVEESDEEGDRKQEQENGPIRATVQGRVDEET